MDKNKSQTKLVWKTEKRKVSELIAAEKHPRLMTKEQAKQLLESIKKYNLVEIPAIDIDNRICAGYQRVQALKTLGSDNDIIDVRVPNRKLTEQEFNGYLIASNKITGEWDFGLLKNFDKDVLFNSGFRTDEIDKIFHIKSESDDKIPEVSSEPKVKLGDIYRLGRHRILCGDSSNPSDVAKLMGGQKYQLLFSSPPYNTNSNIYLHYKDNLINDDFIKFCLKVVTNFTKFINQDGYICWNMSYNQNSGGSYIDIFYHLIHQAGLTYLETIVWDKGNGLPLTSQLTRRYEHILVLTGSIKNIKFVDYLGIFGVKKIPFDERKIKTITNYWPISSQNSHYGNFEAAFPVELPEKAIEITTDLRDVVVDCFLGSGSTLIACDNTDRVCYGIEIEPHYIEMTIKRWEDKTGEKAVRINE